MRDIFKDTNTMLVENITTAVSQQELSVLQLRHGGSDIMGGPQ